MGGLGEEQGQPRTGPVLTHSSCSPSARHGSAPPGTASSPGACLLLLLCAIGARDELQGSGFWRATSAGTGEEGARSWGCPTGDAWGSGAVRGHPRRLHGTALKARQGCTHSPWCWCVRVADAGSASLAVSCTRWCETQDTHVVRGRVRVRRAGAQVPLSPGSAFPCLRAQLLLMFSV